MDEKPFNTVITRNAEHMAFPDGVEVFVGLCLTKEQAKIAEAEGFLNPEITVRQAYQRFNAMEDAQ